MKVYLAGLISTDYPASLEWREEAQQILEELGIEVLTPMRSKSHLQAVSKDGGITDPLFTSKDIIHRDFGDVTNADVILVHLENFGSPRPLVGTMFELAWAWMLRKPVVAIATAENYLMRRHPFVSEVVAHYCTDLGEAVNHIGGFYARKEAA